MKLFPLLLAANLLFANLVFAAAPPAITELQPRGAQKGRPFTLTIFGTNLGEGPAILSSLPATFTPLGADKTQMASRYATFLVEPTADWPVGIYPIRLKAANGLSNILLLNIGNLPEVTEEESRPNAQPHQNDSIEKAQTLPSAALTLNGTLKGPERDVYRLQIKAGERRVFEVEARRAGSAIDPVIRVLDGTGKVIARSEDHPLLSLDARLDLSFPKEGFYYVEVHDARFSTQGQNFYRLKTGAYTYPTDIFPLGGQRGQSVNVSLGAANIKATLASKAPQTFVNLPDSPSLPLPFAIGDFPELVEPVSAPLTLPVTVNARLAKPAEADEYTVNVTPGEDLIFELQARELGTSKLTGLITILDDAGNKLASAGDGPLPVDVAAVQASSRTLGDPFLLFQVPANLNRIKVRVEDLALRGGPHYAYRLRAFRGAHDFQASISAPFVNIPAGGTALVPVVVARRGYMGAFRMQAQGLPPGVTISGGDIPPELPDPLNRTNIRRTVLTLTATADTKIDFAEIAISVIGGKESRLATGVAYQTPVAGATAQGVVDRQRNLSGAWLGYQLPLASADPTPANLSLKLERSIRKAEGIEFHYRWTWQPRDAMQSLPDSVNVDVPNFQDLRAIEMAVDPKDRKSGTFIVTSTRNTLPALYNISVFGRLMAGGAAQDIYAPLLNLEVPALDTEEKSTNAAPTPNR
jgi:hypothetical protein